jgi:hypothetical protein
MNWMNVRSPLLKAALPVVSALAAAPVLSTPLPVDSYSASDLNPAATNELNLDPETAVGSKAWGVGNTEQDAVFLLPSYSPTIPLSPPLTPPVSLSPFQPQTIATSDGIQTVAQAEEAKPSTTPDAKQEERREENDRHSPVLEKWEKQIPNVLEDIKRDPSFRTRVRLGLSYFPSTFDSLGWNVGVEDILLVKIGATGLTLSGDYQATFTGARKAGGADLRYYLLPLGGYFNLAPVLGYRYLETPRYITDGLNVGFRVQAVLSRTGAADISLTQTWVDPQQSDEVGITKLSFGFALTHNLRVSTDIEKQNSNQKKDTRYGISMEWMF